MVILPRERELSGAQPPFNAFDGAGWFFVCHYFIDILSERRFFYEEKKAKTIGEMTNSRMTWAIDPK